MKMTLSLAGWHVRVLSPRGFRDYKHHCLRISQLVHQMFHDLQYHNCDGMHRHTEFLQGKQAKQIYLTSTMLNAFGSTVTTHLK